MALLVLLLSACSEPEHEPAPTVVIVGPDVRPTKTLPPTPTLRQEPPTEPVATESLPTGTPELATEETPDTSSYPPAEEEATEQPTEPPPTDTPQPTATLPVITDINGMQAADFIIMSPQTRENVRAIFAQGQAVGRDPNVFSILGDSLIATPQSLAQWDTDSYDLGDYAYLQPTIDRFSGSFGRYGPSVRVGLHSWSVSDPLWADKDFCLPNEDVLTCELRLNNPSIMLVFLGSNDAGLPGGFKINYKKVVEGLMANGVVPILATKADRFEGPDNANNIAIREVAAELEVPLLEFDLLANTLPGRGLGPDNVHLTYLEPVDYTSPGIMAIGYPVHNLAVLIILDEVTREFAEQ